MSWVCANCSNPNDDANESCEVCGYGRPPVSRSRSSSRRDEVVEGKIVFSDFAVIKESFKEFFRTIGRICRKLGAALFILAQLIVKGSVALAKLIAKGSVALAKLIAKGWRATVKTVKKWFEPATVTGADSTAPSEPRPRRTRRARASDSIDTTAGTSPTATSSTAGTSTGAGTTPPPPPPARPAGGYAEPWPEHRIRFDPDAIRSRGYVSSERFELGGVKGYKFYKADGTDRFIKVEMLTMLRMATKI